MRSLRGTGRPATRRGGLRRERGIDDAALLVIVCAVVIAMCTAVAAPQVKDARAPVPAGSFFSAASPNAAHGARSAELPRERVLLFDAGGHVHSFDRDTGAHHWSSKFGPPLLSSYSQASAARRLVPMLGGGGVLDVETDDSADTLDATQEGLHGDSFDWYNDLDLNLDPETADDTENSDNIDYSRSAGELDTYGKGRLNLHGVHVSARRFASQGIASQGIHGSPRITVTPLPKIPAMVAASPFSLSLSPDRTVNVLGSHNTTMFTLDVATGQVGSYICASQPGPAGAAPSSPRNHGNQRSTIWIGRTDSVLRAFDRLRSEEMWNVSSSEVRPQPVQGLSDPPRRIYEFSASSDDTDIDDDRSNEIFLDEIVTRAGFHATFMETAAEASMGSSRRHSRVLWDTISEAPHLKSPISSAYLVTSGIDTPQISPIPVKHMVPRRRGDSATSSSTGVADEAYIHAFGEGTEMFGLSRSEHFFNTSGDISIAPRPQTHPSLALPDGSTTMSSTVFPFSSAWIPTEAELSNFVDRLFPINSPSWTSDSGNLLLPSPFDDGGATGNPNNISNINPASNSNLGRFNESTILLLLVALAIMMILLLILLAIVYQRGNKLRSDMARLTSPSMSSSLPLEGRLRTSSDFVPPLMIANTPEEVLGNGSHGTVVYAGKFGDRPVAIKRMLRQFYELAEREIALLTRSDGHPHLVRYHAHEVRGEFIYLGLEQCEGTLSDFLDRRAQHMSRHGLQSLHKRIATDGVVLDEIARNIWCADRHARRVALLGLVSGVQHIHSLRIVHRDLKPQNVLLVRRAAARTKDLEHSTEEEDKVLPKALRWSSWMLKISDMGLGKALSGQRSSFGQVSLFGKHGARNGMDTGGGERPAATTDAAGRVSSVPLRTSSGFSGVGTEGYLAPELLSDTSEGIADGSKSRTTRSVDIFSLGCVLFEAFSETRQHLFGGVWKRQYNILAGKVAFPKDHLGDDVLGIGIGDIVLAMTSQRPESRPSADDVMNHPAFWTTDRWLRFLEEFSDRAGHQDEQKASDVILGASQREILAALERTSVSIIGLHWDLRLGQALRADLNNFRRYDTASVKDCLRFIRNKRHHLHELSTAAVKAVGSTDRQFFDYFFDPLHARFPKLPMRCVGVARKYCASESMFAKYFVRSNLTFERRASRTRSFVTEPTTGDIADAVVGEREIAVERDSTADEIQKDIDNRTGQPFAPLLYPSTQTWVLGQSAVGSNSKNSTGLASPIRIPKRYKTKLCKFWRDHSKCENTLCTFALHPCELRIKEHFGDEDTCSAPSEIGRSKKKKKKKKRGNGKNRRT